MPPFSTEEFLSVFDNYNESVWPMQLVLYAAGWVSVGLCAWKVRWSDRIVTAVWFWMGAAYHIGHFSRINPAADGFGVLFIIQAVLFLNSGLVRSALRFRAAWTGSGLSGAVLIGFALLVYPLLSHGIGHRYPQSPTFGLPCPTTIFTLGLLLWTDRLLPAYVLVIPAVWSLIGSTAAVFFGIWEDLSLFAAAVVAVPVLVHRITHRSRSA